MATLQKVQPQSEQSVIYLVVRLKAAMLFLIIPHCTGKQSVRSYQIKVESGSQTSSAKISAGQWTVWVILLLFFQSQICLADLSIIYNLYDHLTVCVRVPKS